MHDFDYITKNKAKPVKKELINIIFEVQDLVREYFTFNFYSVGSSKRNMITWDKKSNIGYDFDFNIEVNDDDEEYSAEEIRKILKNAFDKTAVKYGYSYCEDSTSVLTIKKINTGTSSIKHSCDFAIVYNCKNGRQQYIRFNKADGSYTWEYRSKAFEMIDEKFKWLKNKGLCEELRDYYIHKKNNNDNPDKHSRSLFAEAINDMCNKHGFNE